MSGPLFHETFSALVDTLHSTYPSETKCTDSHNAYKKMQRCEKDALYKDWCNQLVPMYQLIVEKNEELFRKDIPVLINTGIVHLWISDSLSPQSKKYIWMYLKSLGAFCRSEERKSDIQPPPNKPSSGTLQDTVMKLYESLPEEVVESVNKISQSLSESIKGSEMDYATIASQFLNNIDQSQIADVLKKVGGLVQESEGKVLSNDTVSRLISQSNPGSAVIDI